MSDGGTFTLLSGLDDESPFTHLAPVAASFHPLLLTMAEPRRVTGLPVYLVHGALDWMFPVSIARTAQRALTAAGAKVTYREIADLSHAYPREEGSAMLDWFLASPVGRLTVPLSPWPARPRIGLAIERTTAYVYYPRASGITGGACMATMVTSKGQVTIPKPVRDRLGSSRAMRLNSSWRGRPRRPAGRSAAAGHAAGSRRCAAAPAKGSARTRSWRSPAASRRHDTGRYQRPAGPCHQ